jgi:arylsulfatase
MEGESPLRKVARGMAKKFSGKIEGDVRNSVEDWSAFTQPDPPEGSPNVVVILWDERRSETISPRAS